MWHFNPSESIRWRILKAKIKSRGENISFFLWIMKIHEFQKKI